MEPARVSAVLSDWKSAELSDRMRSALGLLEALTLRPQEIDAALLAKFESSGLSRGEMEELAALAFHFNFINRVADAVDFEMPDAKQTARQAKLLNLMARLVTGGKRPSPPWRQGSDGVLRPAELNAAREELFAHKGSLSAELRRSVEGYAAAQWGAERPACDLPVVLQSYVQPLSLHAYQVHDRLVHELRDAGYSDQDLFELTLLAAFGAALAAQERLYALLYGDD